MALVNENSDERKAMANKAREEWKRREETILKWVKPNIDALKKEEKEHFEEQRKNFVKDVRTKLSNFQYHQEGFIELVNKPDLYRMAFYNVNGFNEKNIPTIDSMLTSLDLDVLFLIETKATEKNGQDLQNNLSFKNILEKYERYICDARSGKTRSGGLMILIKKKLFEAGLEKEKLDFIAKPGKSGKTYHECCGITLFDVRYIMVYRNNSTAPGLALVKDVLKLLGLPDKGFSSEDTSSETEIEEEEEEKNLEKEKKLEDAPEDPIDDGSGTKFVILGDFNTSNIQWASKMKSFDFVSTDRSRASEKMIKALMTGTGCNIQYVKAPTSARSMRPIDLLFAKRGQGIIRYVYVPPFLDKQLVRDHVPVYFLVNKNPQKAAAQTLEKKVEQLHLEKNVSRKSESGKNKKAKK